MTAADAWAVADPCACPICGRDACEEPEHPPPTEDPDAAPRGRPRLAVRAADLLTLPPRIEIVEGAASADSLSVVVAESGAGKPFVLLDVAAAVSDALSTWHGRAVEPGSVVYLSFEGDALGLRLRALREIGGHRLERLHVIRASDPLSPRMTRDGEVGSVGEATIAGELDGLATDLAAQGEPLMCIVDTVRASLTGSEDSSEHVAAYLRAVRRLMTRTPGAGWILAHHTGWQDSESARKRERGSSAWRGNCDTTLYLDAGDCDATRGEAALTLRALKVRDAERPAPLHLVRRRVELLQATRYGDPVTSCVIERDRRTREDRETEQTHAAEIAHRAIDLQVLRGIVAHPAAVTSKGGVRAVVGLQRDQVYDAIARLLQREWIAAPERQRQPYTVAAAGQAVLTEATTR